MLDAQDDLVKKYSNDDESSKVVKIEEIKTEDNGNDEDNTDNMDNKDIDFRVSTFPTPAGEKVVIRVLDPAVGLKSIDDLGLVGKTAEMTKEAIKEPFGMVLLTGPTGSGKTTTLYALLQLVRRDELNVVSLEDPIEYYIEGVSQSQVKPEIGYTFASGLRQILRQDPDVIMVGEVRDSETAELAVHAALTGHVVLATLHTNDAVGVIPRLIDMGVEPFLIPSSLNLVAAQRLVKKLCPDCRKEVAAPERAKEIITNAIASMPEGIKKDLKVKDPIKIYEPHLIHAGLSCRVTRYVIRIVRYIVAKAGATVFNCFFSGCEIGLRS